MALARPIIPRSTVTGCPAGPLTLSIGEAGGTPTPPESELSTEGTRRVSWQGSRETCLAKKKKKADNSPHRRYV